MKYAGIVILGLSIWIYDLKSDLEVATSRYRNAEYEYTSLKNKYEDQYADLENRYYDARSCFSSRDWRDCVSEMY
jgi:hypothetical protein